MDVFQTKSTTTTMKKLNHKNLNSAELAEETRRMEMQLAKIKAEKDKLTKMVPSALPGTLHWSSAAIENSKRNNLQNPNEKSRTDTLTSTAGGKKSTSATEKNGSPVSYANTFRNNINGSPSSNQPGILASTSVSAVAGSGLRAVAAMRNNPSIELPNSNNSTVSQGNNSISSLSSSSSSTANIKLQPSQAMHWNVDQVQQWLGVLGLEQHIPIFIQNDIIGQVLLDLTPGDLDYMNITTLGHRKLILKGIDQLKAAVNGNKSSSNNSINTANNVSGSSNIATDVKISSSSSSPTNKLLHWSQTVPQTNNNSSSTQSSGSVSIGNNSNSLLDGQYDEDAERRAFQDAVMAWRKANGKSVSIIKSTEDDGMWTNPFTSNETNDDNNHSSSTATSSESQGGSLLAGEYDEEAERRAFQEAVMAWRKGTGSVTIDNGKTKSNVSVTNNATSESGSTSSATNNRSSCYNCLRIFYGHLGYHPSVHHHESDEEENQQQTISSSSSSTSVRTLTTKPFCSSACYDAAAMGVLRLEAAKNAARTDAEKFQQNSETVATAKNNDDQDRDDTDSVEYEYPTESSTENNHRINGVLTAADYGVGALPPSPVIANITRNTNDESSTVESNLLSPSKIKSKNEPLVYIDNLAAEAEAAGLSLVREYEQQVVARKQALMQANLRNSKLEKADNESKYNDEENNYNEESKEEKNRIDIDNVDMSDYI